MTTKVTTSELRAGMTVRSRGRQYTVADVERQTVRGDGDFPDYDFYLITFTQSTFAPGRGRVPLQYAASLDETFIIKETT